MPVPAGRGIRPALGAAAGRKPRLSFRLSGVFLLRLADRQFGAVLFQLPPRFTRLEPVACIRRTASHEAGIPHPRKDG